MLRFKQAGVCFRRLLIEVERALIIALVFRYLRKVIVRFSLIRINEKGSFVMTGGLFSLTLQTIDVAEVRLDKCGTRVNAGRV